MLITESIEIKWTRRNKEWYEGKGYVFTDYSEKFEVNPLDLSVGSHKEVEVECDYCSKLLIMKFKDFNKQRNKTPFIEDVCLNCSHLKSRKNNLLKYGVDNPMQREEVKVAHKQNMIEKYGVEYVSQLPDHRDKVIETSLKKYGVENYTQTEDFLIKTKATNIKKYGKEFYTQTEEYSDRYKETCLEKYGVDNALKSEIVREKVKTTNLEKYGAENVFQSEDIKDKIKNTNVEKYGVPYYSQTEEFSNFIINKWDDWKESGQIYNIIEKRIATNLLRYGETSPMKVPEIRDRALQTMYANGTAPTSKQQIHIHSILGGELNYPIGRSLLDIAFVEDKIYFEYDGGGHDLSVKLGDITKEEFIKKENRRTFHLLDQGWKEIRILSVDDKLPSDSDILKFVESAKTFLLTKGFSVKWDLGTNIVHTNYKRKYNIKDFINNNLIEISEAI